MKAKIRLLRYEMNALSLIYKRHAALNATTKLTNGLISLGGDNNKSMQCEGQMHVHNT